MKIGTIASLNLERGYGTIYVEDAAQQRYFFYVDRVISGIPRIGAQVYFHVYNKPAPPGRLPYADGIAVASAAQQIENAAKSGGNNA